MSLNSRKVFRRRKGTQMKNPLFMLKKTPVMMAEGYILGHVQKQPMSPVELVRAVREQQQSIDEADVRKAMWRLVSKGAIEFAPGWRLTVAQ